MKTITKHYIDGEFVESHGREVIEGIRPTDGKTIIYAIMNEIRIFASPSVIEEAEKAIKVIIDTYRQKNKEFKEVVDDINTGFTNPLRAFSEACHHELNRS